MVEENIIIRRKGRRENEGREKQRALWFSGRQDV